MNSKVKTQEVGEWVGREDTGCYRPEITLDSLDVTKSNKEIYDGFCNGLSFPMKTNIPNDMEWQMMFAYLADKAGLSPETDDEGTFTNVQLQLDIDDNSGERKYYIGAFIPDTAAWDYDKDNKCEEYVIEEIHPNDKEQAIIELALLKITDPKQFLLKYTRYQIAQLPQIMNAELGFVIDGIRNDDLYASVWLAKDQKTCMLACIQNVHDKPSRVQLLKVG